MPAQSCRKAGSLQHEEEEGEGEASGNAFGSNLNG